MAKKRKQSLEKRFEKLPRLIQILLLLKDILLSL